VRLAVAVAVILLAALGADAAVTALAEQQAAREATAALAAPTSVDLRGWPVSLRLVLGGLPEVDVRSSAVPLGDTGAALTSLDATLTDVSADLGELLAAGRRAPVRARGGRFTAVLDEAGVERLAGLPITITLGDGTVELIAPRLRVEATAAVGDGGLILRPLARGLERFAVRIPLEGLPPGLVVEQVRVEPGRVIVEGPVQDLVL
jgi:hypothetical protein